MRTSTTDAICAARPHAKPIATVPHDINEPHRAITKKALDPTERLAPLGHDEPIGVFMPLCRRCAADGVELVRVYRGRRPPTHASEQNRSPRTHDPNRLVRLFVGVFAAAVAIVVVVSAVAIVVVAYDFTTVAVTCGINRAKLADGALQRLHRSSADRAATARELAQVRGQPAIILHGAQQHCAIDLVVSHVECKEHQLVVSLFEVLCEILAAVRRGRCPHGEEHTSADARRR